MARIKGWLLALIITLLVLGALPAGQAWAQVSTYMFCSGNYAIVTWINASGFESVGWVTETGFSDNSGFITTFSGSYAVLSAGLQVTVTFYDSYYGSFPLGNITCPPPEEVQEEPAAPQLPPPVLWSGERDGRLNPDAAENFSLFCANDLLNVWAGGGLLAQISLRDLINLRAGGATAQYTDSLGGTLTLTRGGDTLSVAGPNGYFGPGGPAKTFSLRDCLRSNNGPLFGRPCKYCDL